MKLIEKIIKEKIKNDKIKQTQEEDIKEEITQKLVEIRDIIKNQKFVEKDPDVNYKKLIFSAEQNLNYDENKQFDLTINVYRSRVSKLGLIILNDRENKIYEQISIDATTNTIDFTALTNTRTLETLKDINKMLEIIVKEQE